MSRPRRLATYFTATCNGTDVPPKGCAYRRESEQDGPALKAAAQHHARYWRHETVVTETTMVVYDEREVR
jgi:hypothetical protein